MLRIMCDGCGKELGKGEAHHVVKIEVFANASAGQLTEEDLDRDHLEEVAEILAEMEEGPGEAVPEPSTARLRYDLCSPCRRRYMRDPLAKENAPKLHFSKN
jgi:hypothetical protein